MIKILIAVAVLTLGTVFILNKEEVVSVTETSIPEVVKNVAKTEIEKPNVITNSSGTVLDLSNQGLTKTPAYVFSETHIQELDLSYNNLTGSLQAEVRHLQNLKVLDLSNNQFTGVPAEIGQLKNLEVLDLSNNQLTGLPNELGNLSNLKVLNLQGNAYSVSDLESIRKSLPTTKIVVD